MKTYSKNSVRGKLDKLVGNYYRNRPCDYKLTHHAHKCKGRLEWCHIKSRRYLATRWLNINCLTLCSRQHFFFTDNPDLFIQFVEIYFPNRLKELNKIMTELKTITEKDLEELLEKKKEELL